MPVARGRHLVQVVDIVVMVSVEMVDVVWKTGMPFVVIALAIGHVVRVE